MPLIIAPPPDHPPVNFRFPIPYVSIISNIALITPPLFLCFPPLLTQFSAILANTLFYFLPTSVLSKSLQLSLPPPKSSDFFHLVIPNSLRTLRTPTLPSSDFPLKPPDLVPGSLPSVLRNPRTGLVQGRST
ncbi:hypothetical protein BJ138DRAFT_1120454 [Hygrophoropsis aurantiaca]|uniref:Uncharacterized protein n=1 Tax=Hygrophoropsis aurantiaca TaxID=72124 RepID=A0ACB7ZRR4_9AGAM|nr:hypothetical protein BJ138DRAFT_1120454 [Hygrophoropsis aurantiaca]